MSSAAAMEAREADAGFVLATAVDADGVEPPAPAAARTCS
jgi:hypothetical protein